jgi:hypothetical protein
MQEHSRKEELILADALHVLSSVSATCRIHTMRAAPSSEIIALQLGGERRERDREGKRGSGRDERRERARQREERGETVRGKERARRAIGPPSAGSAPRYAVAVFFLFDINIGRPKGRRRSSAHTLMLVVR